MKRMAFVLNLQLTHGIILAAALCGLSAIGQNTPYYGYTNLAGLGGSQGSVDGTNTVARFNQPYSVALDPNGNAFVADSVNHTICKVTPEGGVTTFAGLAGNQGSTDGTGTNARFSGPQGVATDLAGNIYVCDSGNSAIRKITPNGAV